MIKLIADSGSTKTDWCLLAGEERHSFQTIGFNPFFVDSIRVTEELENFLLPDLSMALAGRHVDEVHFYGAGCSSDDRKEVIAKALRKCFPKAEINVDHDLLGAARALCGRRSGIAAILGTGSNSCYYDGEQVVHNVPALGYILGDEGSAGHIGVELIKAYINGKLPQELREKFDEEYSLSLDDILTSVYMKPLPNRFLAGFSKFVGDHIGHTFCHLLVCECFVRFFEGYITKYEKHNELELNVIGTVAVVFERELRKVSSMYDVNIGRILKSPIEGLIEYHRNGVNA